MSSTSSDQQSPANTHTHTNNSSQLAILSSGPQLTPQFIKNLCKQQNLYQTPHLNDKLYLHHKGLRNLDSHGALLPYTNLRALWLEGNALKSLSGALQHLKQLRCLYLHQNLIEDISGLEGLEELRTLNLSQNRLSRIEAGTLSTWCPMLNNLNLAQNKFVSIEDLGDLCNLEHLSVLDLSDNKIDGDEETLVDNFLSKLKSLSVLYLKGNPVVNRIRSYRKVLISRIKTLQYIDDRPVFDDERRCAEAWALGGVKAEQEERKLILQEKRDKEKQDLNNFREWQRNARVKRLQKELEDKMRERIARLVRPMLYNFEAIAKQINDEFRNIDPNKDVALPIVDENFEMAPYEEIDAQKCRQLFVEWKDYPYEKREIPASWSAEQKAEYEKSESSMSD
eukprot:CAMPEP_0117439324 /NCGR_PEP_ID=MMETSP0759-20121206/2507_1 /TAXON_ID=63605 /ORGANISM="Percolomonas cosmopolitus, Strain WS" /LENGTH=394 /DNA_ID=CAMNT_0005231037 /DNA_START=8 /DNA_END=1192 /DNA_ORIENTATION=-